MTENPLDKLADAVRKADAPTPAPPPETIAGTCPACEEDVEIVPPDRGFDFTAIVQCDHCGRHTSLRAFKAMHRRKQAEREAARQRDEAVAQRKAREAAQPRGCAAAVDPPTEAGDADASDAAAGTTGKATTVAAGSTSRAADATGAARSDRAADESARSARDESLPRPRLIGCGACGRKCSDRAAACPRCGHPLQARQHGDRPVPASIEASVGRINALASVLKVASLVVIGGAILAAPFTFGMSLTFAGSAAGGLAVAAILRALAGIWSACEFNADQRWRDR